MDSPLRLILGLVLLALPLLELALLIKLGQVLGFWPVVLAIVATGVIGFRIVQTQGLATFRRVADAMDAGREPHKALAEGALLLMAGVLLILPGPLGDVSGLLLLIPPLRQLAASAIFSKAVVVGRWSMRETATSRPADDGFRTEGAEMRRRKPDGGGRVIDGEFERIDEEPVDPNTARPPRPPRLP